MSRRAVVALATFGAAFVSVVTFLGVAFATDGEGMHDGHHVGGGHAGAVGQMGMDSGVMLEHMREVLGEDSYQAMLQHMQGHPDCVDGQHDPGAHGMMPGASAGHMFQSD